jgi:hypothetical protein
MTFFEPDPECQHLEGKGARQDTCLAPFDVTVDGDFTPCHASAALAQKLVTTGRDWRDPGVQTQFHDSPSALHAAPRT